MFERFTSEARQTVVGAQEEARRLHAARIGTEHLLLALLAQEGSASAAALARHGLVHDSVAETIRGYGTAEPGRRGADHAGHRSGRRPGPGGGDVRPRRPGRARPGGRPADHIPFSPRAKKVLELSLREAIAMKSKSIADGHIALGLLREGEGLAMKVLHDRGIDTLDLRRDLTTALRS